MRNGAEDDDVTSGFAPATIGLCATCSHARRIVAARSTFLFCERSTTEPERFPRYPRLPVLRCLGHEMTG